MYEFITNPATNRKVSVYGKIGQNVIRNYMNQFGGDKTCGSGTCTRKCSNTTSSGEIRLNHTGWKEYKEYKNLCPGCRKHGADSCNVSPELEWDTWRNPCRNEDDVNKLIKYGREYQKCSDERQDFNNKCIQNGKSDPGHKHAIKQMREMGLECTEKAEYLSLNRPSTPQPKNTTNAWGKGS